jgi:hypothetical protein
MFQEIVERQKEDGMEEIMSEKMDEERAREKL